MDDMAKQTASTMKYHGSTLVALGIIGAVGVQCMYGLVYRNGYLAALQRLYTEGPFVLPGSSNPILTKFTEIKPLDKLLTLANILFANILDGSTPQSSLYSFQFAGQLVPLFTLLLIEDSRNGNDRLFHSRSVIWGCLMQGLGYGFVMPIYCIVHLRSSSTAATPSLQNGRSFETLPLAMVLGYIVPSILMSVPLDWLPSSLPSNLIHQWFTGLWQGAPVWISLFYLILQRHDSAPRILTPAASITEQKRQQSGVDQACSFAYICAAFTQLCTFGLLAFKKYLPLSSRTRGAWTFSNVFIPPQPWTFKPMPNMAIGIMNFFQYDQYIGSLAGLIWATALHRLAVANNTPLNVWLLRIAKIYIDIIVAGPAAVIVKLIQDRDRLVLEQGARATRQD